MISSDVFREVAFDAVRERRAHPRLVLVLDLHVQQAEVAARSISSVRTPSNRSPTRSNRSQTLSIRKSCGSKPPWATSSHVSGVETGARASGRSE